MPHKAIIIDQTCIQTALDKKDYNQFKTMLGNYDSEKNLSEEVTSQVIELNNQGVFHLEAIELMVQSNRFDITEDHCRQAVNPIAHKVLKYHLEQGIS